MIYFATWIYIDEHNEPDAPARKSVNPKRSTKATHDWRCILAFFVFAKRNTSDQTDLRLSLFTNVAHLPILENIDLNAFLLDLGVDIVRIEHRWRPEFFEVTSSSNFFIFDILDYFEVHAQEEDHFVIADPTCLVASGLSPLFRKLEEDLYLALGVEVAPDDIIDHMTRRDAAALYGALRGTRQPLIAPYIGSEFFGISGKKLGAFLAVARDSFAINNRRALSHLPYLAEASHFLSFILCQLDLMQSNINLYVRRIWTGWKPNNSLRSDLDLLVWHVPAEKDLGLRKLAKRIAADHRKGRSGIPMKKAEIANLLGIGRPRWLRFSHMLRAAMFRVDIGRQSGPKA